MQLIPLTGTITMAENQNTAVVEDATYTPHGDDNSLRGWPTSLKIDATHTPHGDDNLLFSIPYVAGIRSWMQLIPLTGTITFWFWFLRGGRSEDATHTPHGDDNAS